MPSRIVNLRNAVGIVLLAGAAAASYWWSRPPPPEPAGEAGGGASLPGYYIKGARFTDHDEQGRVALWMSAKTLAELPDERYTLEGVQIEHTPADETPWSISASSATAPKDRSQVELEGDVDMHSTPTDGSKPTQILTSALHFAPRESLATADGTVEVRVGDLRLTGVGLRALLNAKRLELESNVHARLLSLLPALALSTTVAAQGGTSCDAPIDITSESFLLEQNLTHFVRPTIKQCSLEIRADDAFATGVDFVAPSEWRFTGHVRITAAGNTMAAESAVFTFEKNQLTRAELTGAPASFSAARAEPGKEPVTGSARKIVLDYVAQTLRLSEQVEITKDRLRAVGCDVLYDFKNETMASGDANCGAEGYRLRVVPPPPKAGAPEPPP